MVRSDHRFAGLSSEERNRLADCITRGKLAPPKPRGRGRQRLDLDRPITRAEREKFQQKFAIKIIREIKDEHPEWTYDQIADKVLGGLHIPRRKTAVLSELNKRPRSK